jgi:hypothetical protein
VTTGKRETEFGERARKMAEQKIGPNDEAPGLPANLTVLDEWIDRSKDSAEKAADEIAILIGQSQVLGGAKWQISLAISDSLVLRPDDARLNPFKIVAARFEDSTSKLSTIVEGSWTP